MLAPTFVALKTLTVAPLPRGSCPVSGHLSVSSTGTTASAPSGNGAPVMMRAVSPGPTAASDTVPAGMSVTTRNVTGVSGLAPAVSAVRTA